MKKSKKIARQAQDQSKRAKARNLAAIMFKTAEYWARKAGLTLIQRSPSHYQITTPDGALLNLYPTTGRTYEDPGRLIPGPPLQLPHDWTLLDAVRAVAERVGKVVPGAEHERLPLTAPARKPIIRRATPIETHLHQIAAEAIRRTRLQDLDKANLQHLSTCSRPTQ